MITFQRWISRILRMAHKDAAGGGIDPLGDLEEPASWVVVLTLYGDPVTERIAVSRLADEGIASRVRRESAGPIMGLGVGLLARVDILVPESLEGKAIDVLDSAVDLNAIPDDEEDDLLDESDL